MIQVRIKEFHDWNQGEKGIMKVQTEDGFEINFFDENYAQDRKTLREGDNATVYLKAFGYQVELMKNKTYTMTGDNAIEFRDQMGEEQQFNNDGTPTPIQFDLSNVVGFQQSSEDRPEDASFMSPVYGKPQIIQVNREHFIIADVCIHFSKDKGIFIPLCIPLLPDLAQLKAGDNLRGFIWMQGRTINS